MPITLLGCPWDAAQARDPIEREVSRILEAGARPLALGGDPSEPHAQPELPFRPHYRGNMLPWHSHIQR